MLVRSPVEGGRGLALRDRLAQRNFEATFSVRGEKEEKR